MKLALICALALAAAPVAVGAATLDDEAGPAVTIRYGDLDLSRSHDAKVLLQRIDDASMQACGADFRSNAAEWSTVRRSACFSETMAKTVSQIGAPTLSAVFQAKQSLTVAQF